MIKFFSTGEEQHRYLSNFHPAPFSYRGVVWPTTEHFYQAAKFASQDVREKIRRMPHPRDAKRYAKENALYVQPGFQEKKQQIMAQALLLKFSQNPELMKKLLATGKQELVEDSPYDNYWGTGKTSQGQNVMGKLLMRLRDQLRILNQSL